MSTTHTPSYFRHPAWGVGILVEEHEGKRTIDFQDGVRRIVAMSFLKLESCTPEPGVAQTLGELTKGNQRAAEAKPKSKRPDRPPPAPKMSFDQQVAKFEELFKGGFVGEAFSRDERGQPDPTGKKADKDGAVTRAKDELSAARLDEALGQGAYGPVFESLKATLQGLGLLHPIEVVRLTKVAEEKQADYVKALRGLLHGDGDLAPRFDAMVTAFGVEDPTWTMATVLGALYQPKDHVFVKPSFFKDQALILGIPVAYKSTPDAAVYDQFRGVAREVEKRLREKGHAPRDLLDVYTFIWKTLAPAKPAAPAKGSATPKPS
jgi:hypothetical protein